MSITSERLKALRKEKGMSQNDVANILGITRTAYTGYESGRSMPVRKLNELSNLFGVSTDYIMGNDVEKKEKTTSDNMYLLSKDEKIIIDFYRKLDMRGKKCVLRNVLGEFNTLHKKE